VPKAGACTPGDKRAWSGRRGLDSLLQRAKADIHRGNGSLRGLRGKGSGRLPRTLSLATGSSPHASLHSTAEACYQGTILSALWALAFVENDESPLAILCSDSTTGSPGHVPKCFRRAHFDGEKGPEPDATSPTEAAIGVAMTEVDLEKQRKSAASFQP
jgi:hypothetical protein